MIETMNIAAVTIPMHLQADIIAGTDEMPIVRLEDGSTVQLNASSAIALDFTETRRAVRLLRGQAYFEVANRRVSGTINAADTDAALSFLKEALGVKTDRIGPLIVIRR
ncbi:FecR domain-containing protein [Pararhizobium antarcticum]|uniref:FecR protein domain-containing protein n=1 Tax=Pararhizobium antarcticum TaxID=1798805 RepID=A0A657LZY4_9HYPH|nr:FecR domain-containing protein [Pararhizobium antarcticum]OJF95687.1 hypothetical protein AX761_17250 [Rhizobium sp. 58]OJF99435.1 hypothetical protein AX760_13200 [Pararhizobium antarcticum]